MLLLALQVAHLACFLASYGIALAELSCTPPWVAVTVLEFVRGTLFSFIMLQLLLSMHAMTVWRGKGAPDCEVRIPPQRSMQAPAVLRA